MPDIGYEIGQVCRREIGFWLRGLVECSVTGGILEENENISEKIICFPEP